ncbi:MAG: tetratricopeptide repeat protein [Pseudomonadota bacterium]
MKKLGLDLRLFVRRLTALSALFLLLWPCAAQAEVLEDLETAFRAHREGKYDQAIELYSKIIKDRDLKPLDRAVTYLLRGEAHHDKGDYDRAIQDFNLALKIKSNYAQAYFLLGLAYEKKGQLIEAYRNVRKAKALRPDHERYDYRLKSLEAEMKRKGLSLPKD